MTPDEEAATLARHAPPAGQPWIPQRRSLPDDELVEELAEWLDSVRDHPGVALSALDALDNEMRLREEEKQQYSEWEHSMLAVGTPEALAAVAQVRPTFTGIEVPPELTPTEAIRIQNSAADVGAHSPRHAPAAENPAPENPEPGNLPPVTPAPAVQQPSTSLTTDTGAIAAAVFGAEEFSASTITGQNTVVAALITEAATEAAAAAKQPEADVDPVAVAAGVGRPDDHGVRAARTRPADHCVEQR